MMLVLGITLAVLVLLVMVLAPKLRSSGLDKKYFERHWKDLQLLLKTKEGQRLSIIEADKLVDEALKQLKFNGKTMGERLVSAQRSLTSPDSIWNAHKLRNRLVHEAGVKLTKTQVIQALRAFQQALKDLGAL